MPSLSFHAVSFSWPDATPVFAALDLTIPEGLSALVGRNGIGKSTLLRLAVGELRPTSGHVERPPGIAYVPQTVTLDAEFTVAAALGIDAALAAIARIESGAGADADYDVVGDDWLIEERALAVLAELGLAHLELGRPVGLMSGGEAMSLAIGAALLTRPAVLLLDEPSNNLDADARHDLTQTLASRKEPTLVVSHDRTLLAAVGHIGELSEREDRTTRLRWFGGNIDHYDEAISAERASTHQAVVTAKAELHRQQREAVKHADAAGTKRRRGESFVANRRYVGGAADQKRRQAEETDARVRKIHEQRIAAASERLELARAEIPRDRSIHVDLPLTEVPPRRKVIAAVSLTTRTEASLTATVRGPERIHIAGGNGAGKTTLIETILGFSPAVAGSVDVAVPAGYLAQRLDGLDPTLSVVANVRAVAPDVSLQDIRDQLGRFQFRGVAADAPVARLSGGERFRAALACVLLARPAPQLLILDEPTNNLDFESQAQLIQALGSFRGALLVVSHDAAFVAALEPTRRWEVRQGHPVRDLELSA